VAENKPPAEFFLYNNNIYCWPSASARAPAAPAGCDEQKTKMEKYVCARPRSELKKFARAEESLAGQTGAGRAMRSCINEKSQKQRKQERRRVKTAKRRRRRKSNLSALSLSSQASL
jgi:hypothetical protein